MNNPKVKAFVGRNGSWLFASVGCIVLWILMGLFGSGGVSLRSLIDNAYTASFLAIAGIAQMLVVTTGRGAIDLSIPGMITLGAYTSMGICITAVHHTNRISTLRTVRKPLDKQERKHYNKFS